MANMQNQMLLLRAGLVATGIVGLSIAPAATKDVSTLTRVLYAADLADQANAFCSLANPTFDSEAKGSLGDMRAYMQHIKMEVTYGLGQSEALMILKAAADAARANMYSVLHKIRNDGSGSEEDRIRAWCNTVAKPLIFDVISTHDHHHNEMDDLLEKAKR